MTTSFGRSILGPHRQTLTPAGASWSRTASVVKVCDDPKGFADARSDALQVFRVVSLPSDPDVAAGALFSRLQGYRAPKLYLETWNETRPDLSQLQAITRLLQNAGYKVAGGSYATGDYDQTDFGICTQANVDAIAVHCYWAWAGFTPYNALRYRSYWQPWMPPVLITECGRDVVRDGDRGQDIGVPGWRLSGLSQQAYATELLAYAAEVSKDSYVLGVTPFTNGATSDQMNFDIDAITPLLEAPVDPIPPMPHWLHGADLSDNNGQVNYALAYPALDFVIVEANDGTYINQTFGPNWYNAGVYNLPRLAYIFCRPSQRSGHDDAMIALGVLTQNGINPGDGIVFDMEDPAVANGAGLAAYAIDLIQTIQSHLNVPKVPMYSGLDYRANHGLNDNAILDANGAWWAWWRTDQEPPNPWLFWQYGSGPVPGIVGNVDLDLFNGSVADLKALGLTS